MGKDWLIEECDGGWKMYRTPIELTITTLSRSKMWGLIALLTFAFLEELATSLHTSYENLSRR